MPLNVVINGEKSFTNTIYTIATVLGVPEDVTKGLTQKNYLFLPFWFEDLGGGKYQLHTFDSLPQELKDAIHAIRDDQFLFQIEKK